MGRPGSEALKWVLSDFIRLQRLLLCMVYALGSGKCSRKLLCQSPPREGGLVEAKAFIGACHWSLIFCTDYF